MSAMPARSPRNPKPAPMTRSLKAVRTNVAPIISPIAQAFPVQIPEEKASTKTFTWIVLTVATLGLFLSLWINTQSAQASFQKHTLQNQLSQMVSTQQTLMREVQSAESPDKLAGLAKKMGMVPASSPVFLRLSDGTILGTPTRAKAGH